MPAGRHAHIAIGGPAVGEIAGALEDFCGAEQLPEEVVWRLRVALDEIVANIVAHGTPRGATRLSSLDVWFSRHGGTVEVTIADDGPAFDPLAQPAPDVSLPLEARQPGGLGIALVRALMDDVQYERTTRNILTIRKRIDSGPPAGGAGSDGHPAEQS